MRLSTSFDCTAAAGYLARGPIPYGVPSVVPGVIIHPAGLPWRNVSIAPLGYKWTPGYSTAPLVISFEVWGYDPQTGNWAILIPRSFVTVGTAESAGIFGGDVFGGTSERLPLVLRRAVLSLTGGPGGSHADSEVLFDPPRPFLASALYVNPAGCSSHYSVDYTIGATADDLGGGVC